jgi:hypothetical protein
MGRPSNPNVFAYTRRGTPFQWLLDGYAATWQRDGSAEVLHALVAWHEADAFLNEAVGYTTWDGSAPTLNRILPLECPLRSDMWCDKIELEDFGAYETRSDFYNILGTPSQDWAIYKLTFIKPTYTVFSNFELAALYGNRENERFCKFSLLPRPRERVVSGFGFEYDASANNDGSAWKAIAEERTFIPEYQTDVRATWLNLPVGAVPMKTILDFQTTVNSETFQIIPGGRVYEPGELLFKGLANPIEFYNDAANERSVDLQLLWTAQPGGWNKYLQRSPTFPFGRTYKNIRHRLTGANPPTIPPYEGRAHRLLFVPSNAA